MIHIYSWALAVCDLSSNATRIMAHIIIIIATATTATTVIMTTMTTMVEVFGHGSMTLLISSSLFLPWIPFILDHLHPVYYLDSRLQHHPKNPLLPIEPIQLSFLLLPSLLPLSFLLLPSLLLLSLSSASSVSQSLLHASLLRCSTPIISLIS